LKSSSWLSTLAWRAKEIEACAGFVYGVALPIANLPRGRIERGPGAARDNSPGEQALNSNQS